MPDLWQQHADLRAIVALVEALAQARAAKQTAELALAEARAKQMKTSWGIKEDPAHVE